jgi:hypothetical protein
MYASGGVQTAVDSLIAIPTQALSAPQFNIPAQGGLQSVQVVVLLDGQRIDDKVEVKVNGAIVQLGQAAALAGNRP